VHIFNLAKFEDGSSLNADVLEDESESVLWRWEVSWVLLYKLVLFWFYCFVFFI